MLAPRPIPSEGGGPPGGCRPSPGLTVPRSTDVRILARDLDKDDVDRDGRSRSPAMTATYGVFPRPAGRPAGKTTGPRTATLIDPSRRHLSRLKQQRSRGRPIRTGQQRQSASDSVRERGGVLGVWTISSSSVESSAEVQRPLVDELPTTINCPVSGSGSLDDAKMSRRSAR